MYTDKGVIGCICVFIFCLCGKGATDILCMQTGTCGKHVQM